MEELKIYIFHDLKQQPDIVFFFEMGFNTSWQKRIEERKRQGGNLRYLCTWHNPNKTQRTWKFSQLFNWSSSFPKNQENICFAFMLARTNPLLRSHELPFCLSAGSSAVAVPSAISRCSSSLRRICVNIPTNSSSTLWLRTTEISKNFPRYAQARHFPSENICLFKERNKYSVAPEK